MKKLYFFLMAVLIGLSAQAWTVKFTNPDNWAEVAVWAWDGSTNFTGGKWPGKLMTKEGDVWTYTGEGAPKEIIFNNNNNGSQTGDLPFVDGATYDKNGVVGAVLNDYTVYFKNTDNWEKVYVYTWDGISVGGWPGMELTEKNAEGLYVFTYKAAAEPGPKTMIKFSNGAGVESKDSSYKVGATYDPNGLVGGDDPDPGINYEGWYLNVQGEFNGWNPTGVKFSADGKAEANDLAIGTGRFNLKIWNGSNDLYYGVQGEVQPGTFQVYENGGEMTIAGATAEDKYNVAFDAKTGMMTLTKVGGDDPDPVIDYTTWYLNIVGPFNNWTPEGVKFDAEGVATASGLALMSGAEPGFKIKVWNGTTDLWYCNGEEFTPGQTYTVSGNIDTLMTVAGGAAADEYSVTFNVKTGELQITKTTGVAEVEVEEGEAAYYTLQGVRVANPENGIYVKVANGKATKVVVR